MGKTTRRKLIPEFKAKVALGALKESSTKGELAKKYGISSQRFVRRDSAPMHSTIQNLSKAFLAVIMLTAVCCGKNDNNPDFVLPGGSASDNSEGFKISGKVTDESGNPLAGVWVNNEFEWAKTAKDGTYTLNSKEKRKFVIFRSPSGYTYRTEGGMPRFFVRIPDTDGTSATADMQLEQVSAPDRYTLFISADPQFRDSTLALDNFLPDNFHSIRIFRDWIADINEMRATITDRPVFGVILGDMVQNANRESYLWEIFRDGMAGFDFSNYCAIGNHDHIQDETEETSREMFEQYVGPTNFSFDYGKVHYLFIDNIIDDGGSQITDMVYNYAVNDLKSVPKSTPLMIMMHRPIFYDETSDRLKIDSYKNFATLVSQYNRVICWAGDSHHNFSHVYSTVKGTKYPTVESKVVGRCTGALWVNGRYTADGSPRGYFVVDVNGSNISWQYKCTNYENGRKVYSYTSDDQMSVYPADSYGDGYVYVNVYAWDQLWTKPVYSDSGIERGEMEKVAATDKNYKDCVDLLNSFPSNKKMHKFDEDMSYHMFRIMPTPGAKSCTVSVADRFGRTYSKTISW